MKSSQHASVRFRILMAVALIAAGILGILILRNFEPTDASWYPKCTFHQLTGLHCPGCGSTRAMHALVNGQFVTAMRTNLLLMVGGPIFAVMLWRQRRREQVGGAASPLFSWTLCAVFIVYFVGRNMPSPGRSWLAPPRNPSETVEADTNGAANLVSQMTNRP